MGIGMPKGKQSGYSLNRLQAYKFKLWLLICVLLGGSLIARAMELRGWAEQSPILQGGVREEKTLPPPPKAQEQKPLPQVGQPRVMPQKPVQSNPQPLYFRADRLAPLRAHAQKGASSLPLRGAIAASDPAFALHALALQTGQKTDKPLCAAQVYVGSFFDASSLRYSLYFFSEQLVLTYSSAGLLAGGAFTDKAGFPYTAKHYQYPSGQYIGTWQAADFYNGQTLHTAPGVDARVDRQGQLYNRDPVNGRLLSSPHGKIQCL